MQRRTFDSGMWSAAVCLGVAACLAGCFKGLRTAPFPDASGGGSGGIGGSSGGNSGDASDATSDMNQASCPAGSQRRRPELRPARPPA